MKLIYSFRLVLFSAVLFAAVMGCNSQITVEGLVRFEDGTPLKTGTVYFESSATTAKGILDENGHYVLGSNKGNDGVPPGNYKVYILGASDSGYDADNNWTSKSLIAAEFQSAATSPLTCDVTKKMTFDITVAPPKLP